MTSRDQSCPGQSLAMASWNGAMRKISVDTATHPKSYKFIQIPCCCRMCRTNISPPAQHNMSQQRCHSCFFWISDGYLLGSNLSIPNLSWSGSVWHFPLSRLRWPKELAVDVTCRCHHAGWVSPVARDGKPTTREFHRPENQRNWSCNQLNLEAL